MFSRRTFVQAATAALVFPFQFFQQRPTQAAVSEEPVETPFSEYFELPLPRVDCAAGEPLRRLGYCYALDVVSSVAPTKIKADWFIAIRQSSPRLYDYMLAEYWAMIAPGAPAIRRVPTNPWPGEEADKGSCQVTARAFLYAVELQPGGCGFIAGAAKLDIYYSSDGGRQGGHDCYLLDLPEHCQRARDRLIELAETQEDATMLAWVDYLRHTVPVWSMLDQLPWPARST